MDHEFVTYTYSSLLGDEATVEEFDNKLATIDGTPCRPQSVSPAARLFNSH